MVAAHLPASGGQDVDVGDGDERGFVSRRADDFDADVGSQWVAAKALLAIESDLDAAALAENPAPALHHLRAPDHRRLSWMNTDEFGIRRPDVLHGCGIAFAESSVKSGLALLGRGEFRRFDGRFQSVPALRVAIGRRPVTRNPRPAATCVAGYLDLSRYSSGSVIFSPAGRLRSVSRSSRSMSSGPE